MTSYNNLLSETEQKYDNLVFNRLIIVMFFFIACNPLVNYFFHLEYVLKNVPELDYLVKITYIRGIMRLICGIYFSFFSKM